MATGGDSLAVTSPFDGSGVEEGRQKGRQTGRTLGWVPLYRFGLIEPTGAEQARRWRAFGLGSIVELAGILALGWIRLALPHPPYQTPRYTLLEFVLPRHPSNLPPPLIPVSRRMARGKAPLTITLRSAPTIRQPTLIVPALAPAARPTIPPPPIVHSFPSAVLAEIPRHDVPAILTGAFEATSAITNLRSPRQQVQTGGFGDPSGFLGPAPSNTPNIPSVGSFDLPDATGSGDGRGGNKRTSGTVASAGFGSVAVKGGGGEAGSSGVVREAGFQATERPAFSAQPNRFTDSASSLQPLEITFKPNPAYTAEALRLRIQGDVRLSVVFQATGRLRVLRVQAGLGHGLDEAAVRAAEQIRFKPAQRNGMPVDFPATLDISFQLAE